jgi:hypothetical protein
VTTWLSFAGSISMCVNKSSFCHVGETFFGCPDGFWWVGAGKGLWRGGWLCEGRSRVTQAVIGGSHQVCAQLWKAIWCVRSHVLLLYHRPERASNTLAGPH